MGWTGLGIPICLLQLLVVVAAVVLVLSHRPVLCPQPGEERLEVHPDKPVEAQMAAPLPLRLET